MLKQTVQYTDFDGANKTKNLYFNLTRSEVIDNVAIKDEFQEIHDLIAGEQRDLEMHEVKMILDLIKKLMKMSYGIQRQTAEGDLKFTKKDEIWEDFIETAYYDAFLVGLFEDPGKAVAFLFGIWPKEITAGIDEDQLQLPGMPVKMDGAPLQAVPDVPVAPEPVVSTQSNGQGYTREALLAMPKAQFDEIAGTDPQQMSQELLQIAFIRKNSGE